MSTISKDSIAKTLYELCNEFYKLEKFYEKNLNKPPIKCYLIFYVLKIITIYNLLNYIKQ